MQFIKHFVFWGCLLSLLISQVGCRYYSLSGAALEERLKTIAIPAFEDNSASGQPGLGELLTNALINKFVRQTRLRLIQDEAEADIVLRGTLQRYNNIPSAVTSNEQASLNRLSLEVMASYLDQQKEKEVFNRTFSQTVEYDPNDTRKTEYDAAKEVLDKIANDVFTAATSDW